MVLSENAAFFGANVNRLIQKEICASWEAFAGKITFTTALLIAGSGLAPGAAFAQSQVFVPGNLVVAVEGCGVNGGGNCTGVPNGNGTGAGNSSVGGYGDNQASPLTLFQYAPVGTTGAVYVNSVVLPQNMQGSNFPVSGEYGSSSEATLQLSGSGQYLTIMGYGVNAAAFDANPTTYGAAPSLALGQSGSLTGQSYTPVPRVVAVIDAYGNVSSTTALFNIYNTNNPRSIFTADGTTAAYVSGQGSGSDATGGVFYTTMGAVNNAPTPITGLDTTGNTLSQDTRDVQIVTLNGVSTLYLSVDTKEGSGSARSYIGTLGTAGTPPTTTVGAPVMLNSFGNSGGTGKETITTGANGNGNGLNAGLQINLSPENYFFANASTLYVADGGNPKNNSANSTLGDGGLQKWINSAADGSGTWSLAYTLHQNLGLVLNTSASGSSGLYGLTGVVTGGTVQLYATDLTLTDLDPTHLFGITDTLSFTTASQAAGESFSVLATAPQDSNFKGVSFAPVAPPSATPANLVVTKALTRSSGNVVVQVTITNTGGTATGNVTLSALKVGADVATPLPVSVGTIAAGASAIVTETVPGSVGASGAASSLTLSGTYNGGTFGSSARITLP